MPLKKLNKILSDKLDELEASGRRKGKELAIRGIVPAKNPNGPRYLLEGHGDKEFVRMNSNSYLGMSLRKEVVEAEESAAKKFGAGPGAVRFISGTHSPHIELEKKLAKFHSREAAMIFSSAYAAVMGVITPLIDGDTIVVSDALNHNSIINALRLSRPGDKVVYDHLDMAALEKSVKGVVGKGRRVLIITDGIFSMRGDHAPLAAISGISKKYDDQFPEGVIVLVDDSHGVGAFGETGRGTVEYTAADGVDIVIATLGKALGVNGGYVAADAVVIDYLRETAPFYIYSNPITASEASASIKALEILDSETGIELLKKLRMLTRKFEKGLVALGFEIIASEHPVVPLMVRDTQKTAKLVQYLVQNGVLATGLNFPVVPKGDEEIRFQVSADHTESDIDHVLDILAKFEADA